MENRPAETRAEKLNIGSRATPGSAETISPAVAPKYKQDHETIDIEKGEGPSKLEETSSTESPPQHGAINEYNEDDGVYESGIASRFWRKYRPFGHAIIWLLATAYASR
jgi:hypothetical protein